VSGPRTSMPETPTSTRATLHVLAAHLLGRRRFEASGRFGLRACPGGFGTPAFGAAPEVVRVAGTSLVRETGGESAARPVRGATLRSLADFAGVDLTRPFDAGPDTPATGDVDATLEVDSDAAAVLADWYELAWRVLDGVVVGLPPSSAPATIQLWPEHFDAGTDVGLASGGRVNLGFSPGDAAEPEPYVYLGPRGPGRPGPSEYWNAPFGAKLRRSELAPGDRAAACTAFLTAGLDHLSAG